MKKLISPRAMRQMEADYFAQTGTRSIDCMERAARALADCALDMLGDGESAYVACGPGGNGGDGLACARMLREAGVAACAILAAAPATQDCRENLARAALAGVRVLDAAAAPERVPDLWIDALYGTGLNRAPSGTAARLIEMMNRDHSAGCAVLSADIPSGLDGESGAAHHPCVRADQTVCFQFAKPGLFLLDGPEMSGSVAARDIGIPEGFWPADPANLLAREDVTAHVLPRRRSVHKGDCGRLLIVAGSVGMAGAAAVCAEAAIRAGAGLTTVACPASIVPILQTLVPCAMCLPLPEKEGALAAEAAPLMEAALLNADAAAVGCGLSRRADPSCVQTVLEAGLPAVIDADALNLISESDALRKLLAPRHVVTPHPGEAARLLKRKATDPISDARALSGMGCTALLKGATSVICGESGLYLSASGCAGMAKGGSGDALTGILGALLAENPRGDMALTAALASEIHGLAGEAAQERFGQRSMTPMELAACLGRVLP